MTLRSLLIVLLFATAVHAGMFQVHDTPVSGAFEFVGAAGVAAIVYDSEDAEVVDVAAHLLADDVVRVTGRRPDVVDSVPGVRRMVLIGTVGHSRFIDALVKAGKLDVDPIAGQWESFIIQRIDQPSDGVDEMLVIAGSDRRGTTYGIFTLSEAIGVSPWYWWADVPSKKREQVYVECAGLIQGPPSVKYRGIFINDEDWGLQPWAAKNMDPDIQDIGPNTYAQVFELLLRLKANFIWPAMHSCTKAFNIYPENKKVADRYAIVMGASHCEPMLRNNVTEWDKKADGDWNYETNPNGVYDYWERRVIENGLYENVYTVGMRGIHDSGVPGGRTQEDKKGILERVISDQRKMIRQHVNPDPSRVPQIFCPYKEVLDIYKLGMDLPDDVTIVWPDDNHGYIRNLSTPEERKRFGGSGIYYHMSYWGAPQDYLWLSSTSPAKIAYEMRMAYAYGADRLWVFNVGDIKPCELEMDFAMRLAYDVEKWPAEQAATYPVEWAAAIFGEQYKDDFSTIFSRYYQESQRGRSEHLDSVHIPDSEWMLRCRVFDVISKRTEQIYKDLDPVYRDAFFQLVLYPVKGASLMNQKWTFMQTGEADSALQAYEEIQTLTKQYNQDVAGGKWDGIMDAAPRKRPVFKRPDVKQIKDSVDHQDPLVRLNLDDARCGGNMSFDKNELAAQAPGVQKADSKSRAVISFRAEYSGAADLYFLARCPDDDHDSWFVSVNGDEAVSNDHATGDEYRWLKIRNAQLEKGKNELVITQREPGTRIRQIVLMPSGGIPREEIREPDVVFSPADYSTVVQGKYASWLQIPGLGIDSVAMTTSPYETPSIDVADLKQAPAVTYTFDGKADEAVVESRFLPTHRINEGMQLRYAVQVDDGPVEVMDINVASESGTWNENVLNGFSNGMTTHALARQNQHRITIYLLDPGMALCQVRVFKD
ncbi:MAG: glycosyl hydrolase 115 family protein [Pontiellaceae bacterium]|nr:glycosyl hydrolase 115 family protein [Pontiellaceae bacterium]MBN2786391.1 glycosyl hydrolase 115 family protein [Pontiellaceae bacterium]